MIEATREIIVQGALRHALWSENLFVAESARRAEAARRTRAGETLSRSPRDARSSFVDDPIYASDSERVARERGGLQRDAAREKRAGTPARCEGRATSPQGPPYRILFQPA